jgi:hypothetical protein
MSRKSCSTFLGHAPPGRGLVSAIAQYFISLPPAVVINPLKERLLFRDLQATITVEIKLERDPKEVQTFWIDDAKKQMIDTMSRSISW